MSASSELGESQRHRGSDGVAISALKPGNCAARARLTRNDVAIGVGNQRMTSLRTLRGLAGVHLRQLVPVVAEDQGTRYAVVN